MTVSVFERVARSCFLTLRFFAWVYFKSFSSHRPASARVDPPVRGWGSEEKPVACPASLEHLCQEAEVGDRRRA